MHCPEGLPPQLTSSSFGPQTALQLVNWQPSGCAMQPPSSLNFILHFSSVLLSGKLSFPLRNPQRNAYTKRAAYTHSCTHLALHTLRAAHTHSCTHLALHTLRAAHTHSCTHLALHTLRAAHTHSCTHLALHTLRAAHTHSCTHLAAAYTQSCFTCS